MFLTIPVTASEASLRLCSLVAVFMTSSTLGIIMTAVLALSYSFQAAIMGNSLEVSVFTTITDFISPLMLMNDPENSVTGNRKIKHRRTFFSINKIVTGIIIIVVIILAMQHNTDDQYIEYTSAFCLASDNTNTNTTHEADFERNNQT